MKGFVLSTIVKMCLLGFVMSLMAGHSYGDDTRTETGNDILHIVQRREVNASHAVHQCKQSAIDKSRKDDPPFDIPEYRHHVVIYGTNSSLVCAGTVLLDFMVMTSASCFDRLAGKIVLRFGYQPKPGLGEEAFKLSSVLRSDNKSVNMFDWVLIRIAEEPNGRRIRFTNRVQPVCLQLIACKAPESRNYTMTGMFRNSTGSVLARYPVTVVSKQTCINAGAKMTENQICANKTASVTNSCDGFLGGPVTFNSEGVYSLAGLVFSCLQNNLVIISSTQDLSCYPDIAY